MKLSLKKLLILNVIFLLPLLLYPQQRYSIDYKKSQKKRSVGIKYKIATLKADIISWKKVRKKKKIKNQHANDVKKYRKTKQTKKVQKRMKRSKRKAKRYNDKKPQYNFFERLYYKFKAKFIKKEKKETKNQN